MKNYPLSPEFLFDTNNLKISIIIASKHIFFILQTISNCKDILHNIYYVSIY